MDDSNILIRTYASAPYNNTVPVQQGSDHDPRSSPNVTEPASADRFIPEGSQTEKRVPGNHG